VRDNILGQPGSLRAVADYQFGEGAAALGEAANLLRGAERVVLSGMGSSLFGCLPLETYFNRRGIPAVAIDASELLHYRHPVCGPGCVVVLVSRSGETVEAVKLLPKLKALGAKVIGVTNEPGTTLHRESDHAILVNSARDQLVAIQTYSGALATLLLLGAATCEGLDGWEISLRRAADELSPFIEKCFAASDSWRDLFEPARAVYLLGRGASLASTVEGALLFHEAAKTPAVAMAGSHFRHGPVEVVDREFRAVVFASQKPTAELDGALAKDLKRLGATVLAVGPYAEDALTWAPNRVREELAPLFEIVPVQCAAMRLAAWKGFVPGEFRTAAAITTTETGFA
jgi:glucosamine--fructose-6-phosphate aminotransferase (isomerizing)